MFRMIESLRGRIRSCLWTQDSRVICWIFALSWSDFRLNFLLQRFAPSGLVNQTVMLC